MQNKLENIITEIDQLKIIEPPIAVERISDKSQAFLAGQMNLLLRVKWIIKKGLEEL